MNIMFSNKVFANILEQSKYHIKFDLFNHEATLNISSNILIGDELLLMPDVNFRDGIIAIIEQRKLIHYIHIKNKVVFLTPYLNGHSQMSINLEVNVLYDKYKITKSKYSYRITDQFNNSFELDDDVFIPGVSNITSLKRSEKEPYVYLKINYHNCVSFLEYTVRDSCFSLKTSYVSVLFKQTPINITMLSNNTLKIEEISNEIIKRNELHKKREIIFNIEKEIQTFESIIFIINNRKYIIEPLENGKVKIKHNKKADYLLKFIEFESFGVYNGILFKGKINKKYSNLEIDKIVNQDGLELGNIKWFNDDKVEFLLHNQKLIKQRKVHNTLYAAYGPHIICPLNILEKAKGKNNILCLKNYKNYTFISRINLSDNYSISFIPKLPIYTRFHQIKIKLSYGLSKFLNKNKRNINLFFEKDACSANESAYSVFKKVMEKKDYNSINKYVIDNSSDKFKLLKKKYKNNLIKRFSFKHYMYIFLAKNFISSELSSHVISSRVFDTLLLDKIKEVPLYFLQHGIMFAKPVDNPLALGFHKENQTNNLIKSVISSDLEAKEFYKMGYTDEDLMKTGLPKLDEAYLNPDADRIAFMPTWRYWEEGSIVKGEIENTTYYRTLVEFIETFERAGLIDRLLLVPHNKFAEPLKEKFNQYENIISTNPTEALKDSIIFITDYSSIIYDATYRGAYPIFYWKDKDYLIKNYKAIPPVNEENAPGRIAKNNEELIEIINEAIASDYEIPNDIKEKYKKINEFDDNWNTERVIEELKSLNVL